jgi:hypothetical protein
MTWPKIRRNLMPYKITAEIDEQWLDILGQITRYQKGFTWLEVSGDTTLPDWTKEISNA